MSGNDLDGHRQTGLRGQIYLPPDGVTAVQTNHESLSAASLRGRDIGLDFGLFAPGTVNAITDVDRVRVGHVTLNNNDDLFSGVTAVVIDGLTPSKPSRAGLFVGNGYGKFIGATQLMELGVVETPIVLTSTLSSFRAADAVVSWALGSMVPVPNSINPVVGEINDSWLSSGDPRPVQSRHVLQAIDSASSGPVQSGCVGGGTGACALGFKAGIGSASRVLGDTTLGVIVQANMSGSLRLNGRRISPTEFGLPIASAQVEEGSCVIVVATDGPFDANLLRRLAARAVFALARVGANFSHGSGDYAIAVSTSHERKTYEPPTASMSALFEAVMDAVEEAVIDSILAAVTIRSGNGHVAHSLPVQIVDSLRANVRP